MHTVGRTSSSAAVVATTITTTIAATATATPAATTTAHSDEAAAVVVMLCLPTNAQLANRDCQPFVCVRLRHRGRDVEFQIVRRYK